MNAADPHPLDREYVLDDRYLRSVQKLRRDLRPFLDPASEQVRG